MPEAMRYRDFDGWDISAVGLGCYGMSGAYGSPNPDSFARTIRTAYEAGVNFFDTAEGYGGAEAFLGEVVAPFRKDVLIATKLSGEGGKPDLSPPAVAAACDASLQRLGMDVIDLYQVHFDDPQTPVAETIGALDELAAAGKIRRYGICHLRTERAQAYAELGHPASILLELSPVARFSTETLLPICQDYGLKAIAFSVTGRGILTGRYQPGHAFPEGDIRRMDPLFQRERFRSALRVADFLAEVGKAYAATAVQVSIAWVLAQDPVVCALTGTSSPKHLAENLAASALELSESDLTRINRFLDAEEGQLAEAQVATIRRLLVEPLAADPEAAFKDLVYVLETAVTLGLVDEAEVIAPFQTLFALRKEFNAGVRAKMGEIQAELQRQIPVD